MPRVLWIAPHRLAADGVLHRLAANGHGTALAPGVKTLSRVAEALVSLDAGSPNLLPRAATRWLLEHSIAALLTEGGLRVIAEAARRRGLADAVEHMIGQLKRRGVTCDRFSKWAAARGRAARDRELASVYARYEQQLERLAAADRYDVTRLGVESLERSGSDARWDLVVFDGWCGFDYYERQLVLAIADRSAECWVALTTEDPSARDELTRSARRSAEWLAAERPDVEQVEVQVCESVAPAALERMRRDMFVPPSAVSAEEVEGESVHILAASDPYDEAVQVARRIKGLLNTGVAATDIVVAAASLTPHSRRLQEVFAAYGVPTAIAAPRPVGEDPAVRALLRLVVLAHGDWSFRDLIAVLQSKLLPTLDAASDVAPWRTVRAACEWLVRELQLASGQSELQREVERLAEQATEEDPTMRAAAASLALPVLGRLSDASQALPPTASPVEWVAASERMASRVGLELTDTAWQQVREAATWIERVAPQAVSWRAAEWIAQLNEWMATLTMDTPLAEEGCVRVLAAQAARHCRPAHLLLVGLDEQSFSSIDEAAGLYSEQQYDELVAADSQGHAMKATPAHERAMHLFYDVLRSASQTVTLSFAALDKSGQPVPPSPLVVEACRPLGPGLLAQLEATPRITPLPPADRRPCSFRDWRLAAVHQAAGRKPALLGAWIHRAASPPAVRAVPDSLLVVLERARGNSFGPLEGVLTSPAAAQWFASRFDADHQWSTSQLETYALCPYRFLLGHVLKIAPLGDTSLEIDYSRRGSLLHRVFGELHARLDALAGDCLPSEHPPEEFAEALSEAVGVARQQLASFGIEGVLNDLLAQEVAKWAEKYHAQHRQYDQAAPLLDVPLRPAHFELRFGKPSRHADDDESPASVDEPYVFDLGDGLAIRLGGRIDRVDVGSLAGDVVFQVIDYKSAAEYKLTDAELHDGRKLQPPLYAMAAAEILAQGSAAAWPLRVGYWVLRQKGFGEQSSRELYRIEGGQVAATDEWQTLQPALQRRVREIVEGVRSGAFPMYSRDDDCTGRCDFAHVCRVHQTRSLQKIWPPIADEEQAADA